MILVDGGQQVFAAARPVIQDAVFVVVLIMNPVYQFLWIHADEFGFCQHVGGRRLRTVHCVIHQAGEVLSLVQFGICTSFQNIFDQIFVSFLVHLCVCK